MKTLILIKLNIFKTLKKLFTHSYQNKSKKGEPSIFFHPEKKNEIYSYIRITLRETIQKCVMYTCMYLMYVCYVNNVCMF